MLAGSLGSAADKWDSQIEKRFKNMPSGVTATSAYADQFVAVLSLVRAP